MNAVTELLKANTELRDNMEKINRFNEERDGEVFSLQMENMTLRERLELVEGILKNSKDNYDNNILSETAKNTMLKSNT